MYGLDPTTRVLPIRSLNFFTNRFLCFWIQNFNCFYRLVCFSFLFFFFGSLCLCLHLFWSLPICVLDQMDCLCLHVRFCRQIRPCISIFCQMMSITVYSSICAIEFAFYVQKEWLILIFLLVLLSVLCIYEFI